MLRTSDDENDVMEFDGRLMQTHAARNERPSGFLGDVTHFITMEKVMAYVQAIATASCDNPKTKADYIRREYDGEADNYWRRATRRDSRSTKMSTEYLPERIAY